MLVDIKNISRSFGATLTIETEIGPDEPFCQFQDYWLTRPLVFRGVLQKSGEEIYNLSGRIQTAFAGECARCLVRVESAVDLPVSECFRPAAQAETGEDDDCYRFDGFVLDIGQAIRDNLLLALPQRLLCREDCRGLCPECGASLNDQDCGHAALQTGRLTGFDALGELL
jgi:uncharacterized protein